MQYKNAYKKQGFIFKSNPPYHKMPNRAILTNRPDYQVCDNSITTSKYTIATFLPLNLLVQFSKVANIYFVLIGIMQMIPSISVSGGFPVIFIPLSMVISVSVFKDFFQDLKRAISDKNINNMKTLVLDPGIYRSRFWRELYIGNIIKVKKDQEFPADVILLRTSNQKQLCFLQTKNLDGQTNLKQKKVKSQLVAKLSPFEELQLGTMREQFRYERPNPYIHSFTGSNDQIPFDNNNIALRGCTLRITEWAIGLVIYTGVDSKIMLNSNPTRPKKSRLEFRMGLIVAAIFIVQMVLTFLSSLVSTVLGPFTLFQQQSRSFEEFFIKWGSWVLLFTNFVPISLIVSLQMVKYIQGINISNCEFEGKENAKVTVQTSTLNEELGQIQHIFSDKTGTLTCNHMSFKYMMIGRNVYGYGQKTQIPPSITNVDFHDPQLLRYLHQQSITRSTNQPIYDMVVALAMCHNVIIEENVEGQPKYNASSPDELAFINMAKLCGWQFMGIDRHNMICVKNKEQMIKYKLHHVMEFNSDRKRMSVIVEQQTETVPPQRRIFIYSKGADSVMFERLKKTSKSSSAYEDTQIQLDEWSVHGLRTLVFGKRQIKVQYYEKWAKMYAASLAKLQQLQQEEKSQLKNSLIRSIGPSMQKRRSSQFSMQNVSKFIIDDLGSGEPTQQTPTELMNKLLNDNSILTEHQKSFLERHLRDLDKTSKATSTQLEDILERQMQLIGITAIEDKLQDNVQTTISRLRQAGIKVWMLTGDKKQTAINIGKSCGIIKEDMVVVIWNGNINKTKSLKSQFPSDRKCCLVITGDDLLIPSSEQELLEFVNGFDSIICCRVTPKQKQDMVWMMRKNKFTTLAIGDGANDVNMINTAHVGIGIKGVEGSQAALCSDYAITQFQILGQLLLYHGRECYRKNAQLIVFNFYKNFLLVLPQFWYGFYNRFSSVSIYDPWVYQLYNVMFTSLPIIIFAIFDQRYTRRQSMKKPSLYAEGLQNRLFNFRTLFIDFVAPIKFSLILTHLTVDFMETTINSQGYMFDLTCVGMSIYAQCVFICNFKVLLLAFRHTLGLKISIGIGILFFYLSIRFVEWVFPLHDVSNILGIQLSSFQYWLVIFTTVSAILLIENALKARRILFEHNSNQQKEYTSIQLPLLDKTN